MGKSEIINYYHFALDLDRIDFGIKSVVRPRYSLYLALPSPRGVSAHSSLDAHGVSSPGSSAHQLTERGCDQRSPSRASCPCDWRIATLLSQKTNPMVEPLRRNPCDLDDPTKRNIVDEQLHDFLGFLRCLPVGAVFESRSRRSFCSSCTDIERRLWVSCRGRDRPMASPKRELDGPNLLDSRNILVFRPHSKS
jgi:hypothetical protein